MEESNNYNELLDLYFRNEMSQQEKEDFLSKVDADEKLKEMFEQHGDIIKAIELSSLKSLKDQLVQKEQEFSTPPVKTREYSLYLKIAAGISILAITTWLLIRFSTPAVDHSELFAANYEPYPNVVNPLNRSTAIENKDPYELFELKEYSKSLEALTALKESDTTVFYKGQIHLALNNFDLALESFNEIPESSAFKDASEWYLSLTYLSRDEIVEAKRTLKDIIAQDNAYSKRAEDLLEKM